MSWFGVKKEKPEKVHELKGSIQLLGGAVVVFTVSERGDRTVWRENYVDIIAMKGSSLNGYHYIQGDGFSFWREFESWLTSSNSNEKSAFTIELGDGSKSLTLNKASIITFSKDEQTQHA